MRVGQPVPESVAEAEVIAPDGGKVRLAALWASQPSLLGFLRHFGCIGCAEQLYELTPRLGEIARAGVRTVLVGNGTPEQRDAFVTREALEHAPIVVMTDPDLEAYRRIDLARSAWATFGPRALIDAARALAQGHPHRAVQGDATQQGGVLLVDTRGIVRFFHASRSLGDHPPASDLVDAALKLAVLTSHPRVHV